MIRSGPNLIWRLWTPNFGEDVANFKMAIYNPNMDISVTEFKQRCLEIIREVERTGKAVSITRRGKVVARLQPSAAAKTAVSPKPWERLRGSAKCLFEAGESVLKDEDFEAFR